AACAALSRLTDLKTRPADRRDERRIAVRLHRTAVSCDDPIEQPMSQRIDPFIWLETRRLPLLALGRARVIRRSPFVPPELERAIDDSPAQNQVPVGLTRLGPPGHERV